MKKLNPDSFIAGILRAFEHPPEKLSLASTFRELQGWDSLASVMVVAEIYADYRVQITGDELRACETVADLFSLVEAKVQPTS